MIRVRLGSTWKQDPSVRAALARGGPGARAAAHAAIDAVVLEVDGIDLVSGRAEGPLLDSVEALGEAVLRLLAGARRAEVHFNDGELELVLGRRGPSAVLTAVSMGRPARVLARDVEVDLPELARATAQAASALAADLGALQGAVAPAATGALLRLVGRLEAARLEPAASPPAARHGPEHQPGERPGAPACTFELHDDDDLIASYRGPGADLGALLASGRVVVRAPDGREALSVGGPPFLVLRDLVAFARRLAEAFVRGDAAAAVTLAAPGRHATVELEADLEAGTLVRRGAGPLPCPPLPLARALCEAAVDLCGVFVARNPWQAHNGWVSELRDTAAGALAHVHELMAGDVPAARATPVRGRAARPLPRRPLGPGRMRRLSFRRAWEADVGTPAGAGIAALGELVIAAGAAAVLGLDPQRGEERWRRGGAELAVAAEGTLYLSTAAALAAVDPATGRERWQVDSALLPDGVRRVLRAAGGMTVVLGHGAAAAVGPAGAVAWRIAPPAAHRLRGAALGSLVVVATDAGFLYGVDAATGATRWRLRLPGPATADPAGLGDGCVVACATDLGGSLVAVDAATGRRRFEVPLDITPTSGPVPFAGLLAVAGTVAGDPVVAAVDPAGKLAWEDAPPLGAGALALAPLGAALLGKTAHGACVALDRSGEAGWSRPGSATHPPPRNVPPVVARGIALVPAETVDALDVRTGELLGTLPMAAPVRLVGDARLHAWGVDAAGVVTAVRLETHLSVV